MNQKLQELIAEAERETKEIPAVYRALFESFHEYQVHKAVNQLQAKNEVTLGSLVRENCLPDETPIFRGTDMTRLRQASAEVDSILDLWWTVDIRKALGFSRKNPNNALLVGYFGDIKAMSKSYGDNYIKLESTERYRGRRCYEPTFQYPLASSLRLPTLAGCRQVPMPN